MDKGFLVFGDIQAVLDELTDEQAGELFRGMVRYHNTEEDPAFDGILKYIFIPIKQQMDRNKALYREKCERNRRNILKRYEKEGKTSTSVYDGYLTKTKTKTDTKTETDTDTESTSVDVWSLSRSVLSHLNAVTGASWRVDDVSSVRLISELAHSGYTEDQMLEVIDKKAADWLGDPKVEQYLRPSTLFGSKFEQYLNQPDSARKKERDEAKKKEESKSAIRDQIEVRTRDLERLGKEYEDAYGNMPLRIDLRGKMAVVEAELESLRARIGG